MSGSTYAKAQAQQNAMMPSASKSSVLPRHAAIAHEPASHLPGQPFEVGPHAFSESRFVYNFSQMPTYASTAGVIQTKLAVNRPGDAYEREADRIADQVLAGSMHPAIGGVTAYVQRFSPQPTSQLDTAPASVEGILASAGRPLEPEIQQDMGQRFGYDFSHVRVHSGTTAEQSARDVNANAYTVGHNIVFGAGRFAPGTYEGRRLLAHELTHVVQQSGPGSIHAGQSNHSGVLSSAPTRALQKQAGLSNLVVQRDVIDDVRKKLSYGVFDWAITDSEAMEALAALATIPPANLANELKRLGSKYVTRLLDNLPDAARTGDVYRRVLEALGSTGVMPFAKQELSYGLFDWAITDAEVTRVFNTFTSLPVTTQEQFLADLNAAGRLGRLISHANKGHHALYIRPWIMTLTRGALTPQQREILRTIVAESSDDALDTLKLAAETRFDVTVGPTAMPDRTPVNWDAFHLRQTYLVLDRLPEAHVAKNKELLHLGEFEQAPKEIGKDDDNRKQIATVAGVYESNVQELAINIKATDEVESSIIHETGHAVDAEMGWSQGPEPARPQRGGWKSYGGNFIECANDMVDDSAGAIKTTLTPPRRKDVVSEMAIAMARRNAQNLEERIHHLAWFPALPQGNQKSILNDRVFSAMEIGLNEPWITAPDGGEHLADHIYEESYHRDWSRYRYEARSRMLTPYQFRKATEWFAEAYSAYYQPDPRGKGAKLNDKDPDTKKYFDTYVDTRTPTR